MDTSLDLSVCVATRNRAENVLAMLRSLYLTADPVSFETIVVVNDSQDETAELIASGYPGALLYENTVQEPLVKAQNRAIRLARGRYIALVSDTVLLEAACLLRLLSFLDKNPEAGIAGPKIIDPASGDVLPSARRFPTFLTMLDAAFLQEPLLSESPRMRKHLLKDWDHNSTREVDWLAGDFQIIRREVLEEIGLPDEGFLGMFADADYCRRARKTGWHIYYVHDAMISCPLTDTAFESKPKKDIRLNPVACAVRYLLKGLFKTN